jgi:hypothetical protein
MPLSQLRRSLDLLTPILCMLITSAAALPRWGRSGHEIAGRAAAAELPAAMPEFFRSAGDRLGWLNYEPDRWRDRRFRPMEQAFSYDHYIDIEIVPAEALEAADRFTYLALLQRAGMTEAAREAGLLPFHILELYGRLVTAFKRWRDEQDPEVRRWIEERIINDAGILGHYVADSANPHHTTVHFNGWAEGWHNPHDYTSDRTFHARFEAVFVDANVRFEDVRPMVQPARQLDDVRAEVFAHLARVNGQVDRLYQLEKQEAFSEHTRSPEHKAFAIERLADGATLLRSLWWTAWNESGHI